MLSTDYGALLATCFETGIFLALKMEMKCSPKRRLTFNGICGVTYQKVFCDTLKVHP
jgi:hypothetical protein